MASIPGDLLGRVTFVTGPGKHCGKTSFMNRALALVRRSESPAFLSVGFDGEARDTLGAKAKPPVPVAAGDVFVTADRFLRPSGCSPEVLDEVPGVTVFGRMCVARARRSGAVVLAGPEHNDAVTVALGSIVDGGLARTVLVDGAINRVTQVASFPGAGFVYVLRASRSDLEREARKAARAWRLSRLGAGAGKDAWVVEGPLTADNVRAVPAEAREVVVGDMTKIFLDEAGFAAFSRGRQVFVERVFPCRAVVAILRDADRDEFLEMIGEAAPSVVFDPYDAEER